MGPAFHASEQPVIVMVKPAQTTTEAKPHRDMTRLSLNRPWCPYKTPPSTKTAIAAHRAS
jgi:hypothetical protein